MINELAKHTEPDLTPDEVISSPHAAKASELHSHLPSTQSQQSREKKVKPLALRLKKTGLQPALPKENAQKSERHLRLRKQSASPPNEKAQVNHSENAQVLNTQQPKTENETPPANNATHAESEPVKPSLKSETSRDNKTLSTRSIILRKKQKSAVDGGRDVGLAQIENPICYSCKVPFTIGDELEPLTPITCPRCDNHQVVPARIEQFIFKSQLGRGGMGVTYLAFDESLRRDVAIKLISKKHAWDRESIATMISEARKAAALAHPNIVPIFYIGSVEGTPYIVMELLSDKLLSRPTSKGIALDEKFVLSTGLAITKALSVAHKNGILHLDIKPDNILHDQFGTAKLIDFGLACLASEGPAKNWGTPLYLAPERLEHTGQDYRSDQYSLGVSLWQALAGNAPFDGTDPDHLSKQILNEPPKSLNQTKAGLHEWTCGLIHKMMAYDADARYQDYDDLIQTFQTVLTAIEGCAPSTINKS
ncbi:MAG: serine/threonine protein kinase [Verrucomicrobia bacterium]|nr:serine/threonine protein kinase [Verrucomicrobiota bacterium]